MKTRENPEIQAVPIIIMENQETMLKEDQEKLYYDQYCISPLFWCELLVTHWYFLGSF